MLICSGNIAESCLIKKKHTSQTMDLQTFFGNTPIFIINLPDCVTRREHAIASFEGYNHYEIIEAVDGRNKEEFKKIYNVKYPSTNFNTATIAVICSHAKAIKMAYDRGHEFACVFEDDVHTELIKKCNFTFNDVIQNKKYDWELIQLYGLLNLVNYNEHFKQNGIDIIPRNGNNPGTCYVINRKGMKRFLETIVNVSDDLKSYTIIPSEIIDPEHLIFNNLQSYMINRPFVYYCFETMAFIEYSDNGEDFKKAMQPMQFISRDTLLSLYD